MGKAEVGADGTLWGAYWVESALGEEEPRELRLMSCGPRACDNSHATLDRQPPPVPFAPSPLGLTTTKQGLPVVVYREHALTGPRLLRKPHSDEQDSYNGFFKVLQCLDMSCSQRSTERFKAEGPAVSPLGNAHAIDASIDEEGRLVVAYHGLGGSSLEVATCELGSCRSTAVRKRIVYTGLFGELPERRTMADVEFGADGLPIIGFLLLSEDETITLRVVKCVTRDCATLKTSDVEHLGSAYFDWRYDLEIGPEGDPLIAFFDWDELAIEVIRCTNAHCGATKRSVIANLDDRFALDLALEVGAEETSIYYIGSSLTEDLLARSVEPLDRESLNRLICHDPNCGAS
jgi:hypothetical protein